MSELTAERIRDAAEVVRLVNEAVGRERDAAQYGSSLDTYALTLQLKLDAEAKRERRIEELAEEIFAIRNPGASWTDWADQMAWRDVASALIARYPALVDGPES